MNNQAISNALRRVLEGRLSDNIRPSAVVCCENSEKLIASYASLAGYQPAAIPNLYVNGQDDEKYGLIRCSTDATDFQSAVGRFGLSNIFLSVFNSSINPNSPNDPYPVYHIFIISLS